MKAISSIGTISSKEDYLTVLEAVTGEKTVFTEQEAMKLMTIYLDNAESKFGFADEILVKAVMALDVHGANLLDKADADALAALSQLCADWEPKPEKANAAKTAALAGDVSAPLALALARASLDAYASQPDIVPYREDIATLAEALKQADEATFSAASAFLIRVHERVR